MNVYIFRIGSGKSTVGKIVSEKLKLDFVDMDRKIEILEKMSVNDIFLLKGEQYFRKLESDLLQSLLEKNNIVVGTGGGIVQTQENIEIFKKSDIVVYLSANIDKILSNIESSDEQRPLLTGENVKEKAIKLMNMRVDKYDQICSVKININDKSIMEVVDETMESLKKYNIML